MKPALVADIGGTHARFGLITNTSLPGGEVEIELEAKFRCAEHDSLNEVIDGYLASIGRPALSYGSIAVAAPVWHDAIKMTNLDWSFSVEGLRKSLGLSRLEVINDASAGVLATTRLPDHEISVLRPGEPQSRATRVNIIPGTGFGIGAAYLFGETWIPVQGEGGHIGLAAHEPEEFETLKALSAARGRASPENVLSGPGMLNLYFALAEVRGISVAAVDPAEMTRMALSGEQALAVDALTMYCNLLGALAGDYALVFGAHGGVFLSGGILQRLGDRIMDSDFENRFTSKGGVKGEVQNIPVYLVNRDHPGLLGAAAWLLNLLNGEGSGWKVA
ncbi:MAG: glucokinase [Xanthomonadales bacterium]|nr:glucokinase [Xanthomonadales bacterium]